MSVMVQVGNEEVDISPDVVKFTEATLNEYLMNDASVYSYYHSKYTECHFLTSKYEDEYDLLYSKKFRDHKNEGCTDKLADALAKSCDEVLALRDKYRDSRRVRDQLYGFLKALDKAHENALNLGYNVRREMSVFERNNVKTLDSIIN